MKRIGSSIEEAFNYLLSSVEFT